VKIAHLVETLEVGGAETVVALLAESHLQMGHQPSVHALGRGGPLVQQLESCGIPVCVHQAHGHSQALSRLFRSFRETRPDVVHCHNAFATTVGAPAARLAGVRAVISTRHGLVAPPHPPKREIPFWIAARFCNYTVAVCEATRHNLASARGSLSRRIVTIRNCAAEARTRPNAVPTKSGFTAVTVARLAPPKDHVTLLRAAALAIRSVPDLHLWIIGDGVNGPELRRLAADLQIDGIAEFLGERHDVGDWLHAADVFVLPSLSEGLPISLLEALAASLPVIVSEVGAMPEIVNLSNAGVIVPPGDVNALARALISYAGLREQRELMRRRARNAYEQYFLPERMATQYLELYLKCLGHRSSTVSNAAPQGSVQ